MVAAAVRTEVRTSASGTVAARPSSSEVEGFPDARPRKATSIVASMPQSAPAASGHPDAPVTRRYTTATRSTVALAWLTRTLSSRWHRRGIIHDRDPGVPRVRDAPTADLAGAGDRKTDLGRDDADPPAS